MSESRPAQDAHCAEAETPQYIKCFPLKQINRFPKLASRFSSSDSGQAMEMYGPELQSLGW